MEEKGGNGELDTTQGGKKSGYLGVIAFNRENEFGTYALPGCVDGEQDEEGDFSACAVFTEAEYEMNSD